MTAKSEHADPQVPPPARAELPPAAGPEPRGTITVDGAQAVGVSRVKWSDAELKQLKQLMEAHPLPDGWPPFDAAVSDGCSGGVRQASKVACLLHDYRYWAGHTALDKLKADALLAWDIWRDGWRRVRFDDDPLPYLAFPAWLLLGLGRGLGVALGGWGAFNRKEHKRKRTKMTERETG